MCWILCIFINCQFLSQILTVASFRSRFSNHTYGKNLNTVWSFWSLGHVYCGFFGGCLFWDCLCDQSSALHVNYWEGASHFTERGSSPTMFLYFLGLISHNFIMYACIPQNRLSWVCLQMCFCARTFVSKSALYMDCVSFYPNPTHMGSVFLLILISLAWYTFWLAATGYNV